MILVDGVMKYEGEVKESTNYESKSNFRFQGDHKGNIILIASVKKDKLVKGEVGNAVRIATKTMSISNNKIIRIKHIGYNKSEVYFKDVITANRYLDLKDSDIEYYVPERAKRTKGVLTDWDRELPIHELYEAMTEEERKGIIQIDRLKKRTYNREKQESMLFDTNNLIIVWEGNCRPDKISLCDGMMTLRVRPFVEVVRQCFNCYKFGHVKAGCKAKQRCIICGEEGIHGRCDKPVRCANCGKEQKSTDRKCNIYQYNAELKRVMAENNISLKEAEGLIKVDKTKELPSVTNIRSWPEINAKKKSTFEDSRKRIDHISDMRRERGRATYSEIIQRQVQTIEKRRISDSDESCSEEEEEKNRKLVKGLKKKKDKEQREKRLEDYYRKMNIGGL